MSELVQTFDGRARTTSMETDERTDRLPRFVIDDAGQGGDRRQLRRDVALVTAGLAERGWREGARVILCMPNAYRFVVIHLALEALGAVTVNLPTAFRHELIVIARQTGAELAVAPAQRCAELDRQGFAAMPDGPDLLDRLGPRGAAEAVVDVASRRACRDDVRWLAYTSGSTGTPRAAVHTAATMHAAARAMIRRYELTPADCILAAAPVGHAMGFNHGVRLAADARCGLVLQSSWSPGRAIELIERHRCVFAALPAPFLVDLVTLGRRPRHRLRHLQVGGAPVATEYLRQADALFGEGVVGRYYGSSECGAVLTTPLGADRALRHGTDGVFVPGLEVRLDGPDGAEGELLVRGEQVAHGYWDGTDPQRRFDARGWFHTGDLATVAGPGALRVVGRLDDMVIRGGVNVMPAVVEQHVAAHEAIREAVVVGAPHPRYGEILVAFVVPARDPSALTFAGLRAHLRRAGLARSCWPDKVVSQRSLPRSPTGKPDRVALRAFAARAVPSGVAVGRRLVHEDVAALVSRRARPSRNTVRREGDGCADLHGS